LDSYSWLAMAGKPLFLLDIKPSDFPAVDYTPPFVVGNGANGGTPAAPAVGIPNNFWGFVMIMMGMR